MMRWCNGCKKYYDAATMIKGSGNQLMCKPCSVKKKNHVALAKVRAKAISEGKPLPDFRPGTEDAEARHIIARMGAEASVESGKGHRWTPEEQRKWGEVGRQTMAERRKNNA